MYDMIKSPCLRPVYVTGPFSSKFSDKAVDTTNAIAIASGIGKWRPSLASYCCIFCSMSHIIKH